MSQTLQLTTSAASRNGGHRITRARGFGTIVFGKFGLGFNESLDGETRCGTFQMAQVNSPPMESIQMPMWSPEHPVDLTLAAELIQGQFPELCTDSLQYLGMGWDNCVFRLDDLVFRFPHRAIGVELIEVEILRIRAGDQTPSKL